VIKSIFEILAKILSIIISISKGYQPRRDEIEQATNQLEKENRDLQNKLEKEIKEKEHESSN